MDLDDQIPFSTATSVCGPDPSIPDHVEGNLVMLVLKPDDIVIAGEHPQTRRCPSDLNGHRPSSLYRREPDESSDG